MLGRLEYQYRTDRWPGEFPTLKPWDEFRAQLEDRIALKLAGYFSARAPLRATLEEFPASKVLFGTDFPFEPRTRAELREAVDRVDDLTGLGDARRILAGNARDLV
jgi:predicted TIM-barrel fold metal-dependent hydrolase